MLPTYTIVGLISATLNSTIVQMANQINASFTPLLLSVSLSLYVVAYSIWLYTHYLVVGGQGGTRTHRIVILSHACLPIPSHGQILNFNDYPFILGQVENVFVLHCFPQWIYYEVFFFHSPASVACKPTSISITSPYRDLRQVLIVIRLLCYSPITNRTIRHGFVCSSSFPL